MTNHRRNNGDPHPEPIDWDARLRAAVEATLARRAERRNERAALATSRRRGLEQRHANKLARNSGPSRTSDTTEGNDQ